MARIRQPAGVSMRVARISGCFWARRKDAVQSNKRRRPPPRTRNLLEEDDWRLALIDEGLLFFVMDSSCAR